MTTDETWQRVGQAIKERMSELQMTKAELQRQAKISDKTLKGYMDGQPIVRADKKWNLARALDWPSDAIERILDGRDPEDPRPEEMEPGHFVLRQRAMMLTLSGSEVERMVTQTAQTAPTAETVLMLRSLRDLLNDLIAEAEVKVSGLALAADRDDFEVHSDDDRTLRVAAQRVRPATILTRPSPDPEPD